MKKLIPSLCLCASVVLFAATSPPSGKLTLLWNYPTNELSTNLTFNIYSSPDLSIPLTNWTVLTNVVGTNLSAEVQIIPGQMFFTATASNFWGESVFSNVASTPPLPRSDVNLKVKRGDL